MDGDIKPKEKQKLHSLLKKTIKRVDDIVTKKATAETRRSFLGIKFGKTKGEKIAQALEKISVNKDLLALTQEPTGVIIAPGGKSYDVYTKSEKERS